MKTLFLLTNSLCNIQCTYCFYTTGHEQRSHDHVRPKFGQQIAQRIAALDFGTVILTGGDPLYTRFKGETFALIAALKSLGLRVIMNTSAAYVTDEDIDTIMRLCVDRIDISIDSHDAAVHDAQRGRHADAVKAITSLIARGHCGVVTTTVVTEANADTLRETVLWLLSLGVVDVRIQRAFLPLETTKKGAVLIDAMRSVEDLLPAPHRNEYITLTRDAFKGIPALSGAQCRMGKDYFVCDERGKLTPCFHRSDIALGNLFADAIPRLSAKLSGHELMEHTVPPCFGKHCVSLFDNPKFWSTRHASIPSSPA